MAVHMVEASLGTVFQDADQGLLPERAFADGFTKMPYIMFVVCHHALRRALTRALLSAYVPAAAANEVPATKAPASSSAVIDSPSVNHKPRKCGKKAGATNMPLHLLRFGTSGGWFGRNSRLWLC